MGLSKISWCDYTFNPWIGCSKVSLGCLNCYAERDFGRKPLWSGCWGTDGIRKRTSAANWKQPLAWDRKAKREGTRPLVFCGSLCDVLDDHASISNQWRLELMGLIEATPNLIWLMLTKRPESWWTTFRLQLDNAWWGATVESHEQAHRIDELVRIPAAGHFLSVEPMVGPLKTIEPFHTHDAMLNRLRGGGDPVPF
jgi:protein gp37